MNKHALRSMLLLPPLVIGLALIALVSRMILQQSMITRRMQHSVPHISTHHLTRVSDIDGRWP
jgi:ABC-type molybdate transport system permease subunit